MSEETQSTQAESSARASRMRYVADCFSIYVFYRDHKIVGAQFLFSALLWFFIGAMLALAVRCVTDRAKPAT